MLPDKYGVAKCNVSHHVLGRSSDFGMNETQHSRLLSQDVQQEAVNLGHCATETKGKWERNSRNHK